MKKRISQVFELYALDWRRIYQNKLTLILMLALMVIPSLYAWFNIGALWDPYSNTGDIKIAVYSDDQPVEVMDKQVDIGTEMIKNLEKNDLLGWQFVDSKEALDDGVKSGKYYAGIYIPKNFSENLTSFVNGDIKKPEIVYSVNEKINAIAPKISDKGANTLQETISSEFIGTLSQTLFSIFNRIGFDLDANLPSIKKLTSQILTIDDNLDVIDGYTKELVNFNNKMPELNKKLALANDFVDYLPEVNQMTQKIVGLNNRIPQIEQASGLVYQVQDNIPKLENAGRQIQMIDNDFDNIANVMNQAIDEANKGLGILQDAQKVLPDVSQLATTANEMIPQISDDLGRVQESLPDIASGIGSGLNIIVIISGETAQITSDIATMIDNNQLSAEELAAVQAHLVRLSDRLTAQSQMISHEIDVLNDLQALVGSHALDGVISRLEHLQSVVDSTNQRVTNVLNNWDTLVESPDRLKSELQAISNEAATINQAASAIDISGVQSSVDQLISQAQEVLASAGNITESIVDDQLIERLDNLMSSTQGTLKEAINFLEKYQAELPAVKEEIHSANTLLNGNMDLIVGGINTGANFFSSDFPLLKQKLATATYFINEELPGIEQNIQTGMSKVNDKAPKLEEALGLATTMVNNEWPALRKAVEKASDKIRKGEKDIDLTEVISYLKADATKEGKFLSEPVNLKTNRVYPVPNYGSASTPFYTALCIWVGAILFSSIATTKFYLNDKQKVKYSKRQQFLARWMTFLTVGFFQTLIVILGNQFLLGTYTKNPVWNLVFAFVIGLCFMTMVYVLVALFDNLGKGIAIIILVLSISAGAGNFPIEMSGPFFRAINPYIPFTHAVKLLRESVGGIYWPTASGAIVILICVTIAFFIFGYLIYPKAERIFNKFNESLKKGHILH
ncbi:phage infection protein [Vagococcus penaei]|uniref:Phage infection protein n=1 Tax=Vagococcus penaei TaxID=633807 RepID=A0A1Q2D6S8_9ENTE|nr:YhgE/Pip domain-containing protein [Vagococcus penaei]AQP54126.1 phage infection protein [Vagococcus penaei]RSU02125.1 phage infection protein [Vagococcus penaei]